MGKLVLVLGGARSGKSRFAASLASAKSKRTAFVATCVPADEEIEAARRATSFLPPQKLENLRRTRGSGRPNRKNKK